MKLFRTLFIAVGIPFALVLSGCMPPLIPPVQHVEYEIKYKGHAACGDGQRERWDETLTCTVRQDGYILFCQISYASCNDFPSPLSL